MRGLFLMNVLKCGYFFSYCILFVVTRKESLKHFKKTKTFKITLQFARELNNLVFIKYIDVYTTYCDISI